MANAQASFACASGDDAGGDGAEAFCAGSDLAAAAISADLRKIALIVILIRAGLSLDLRALGQVGRPELLLCFVPAAVEMLTVTLWAPLFFDIPRLQAGILGAVLASVSPAVVVPRMLRLIEEGYGTGQAIPQRILTGASVDDVFVMVVFSSLLGMAQSGEFACSSLAKVPISILLGLMLGMLTGIGRVWFFKRSTSGIPSKSCCWRVASSLWRWKMHRLGCPCPACWRWWGWA